MTSSKMLLAIFLALFAFSAYVSAADTLNYGLIPAKDYNKIPQLAKARDFGVKQILNQGINSTKLANTTYTLIANTSIYNATNDTNVYYKFNLTYNNSYGDVVKPYFVVQYNTNTQNQTLKSQGYTVKYGATSPANPLNNRTNSTNNTNSTTGGSNNTNSTTNPTNNTSTNPNTTNGSNTTTGNSTNTTGFVQVPTSKYNDPIVNSTLYYGMNYVANYAVSKGSLPKSTYKLLTINSIYQQKVTNATNYKFDVTVQDANKTRTSQELYTVKYNQVTGVKSMVSYSYKVLPYST